MKWIAAILVCLLLVGVAPALAQNVSEEEIQLPEPGILPDSPFYGLKIALENLRLALTFDEEYKVKLHLHYAERRLAEAQAMEQRGKPEFVESVMVRYQYHISETEKGVEKLMEKNNTEIIELVSNRTQHHTQVLITLREKLPEEAQHGIDIALNASQHGHNQSISALKKLRRAYRLEEHSEKGQEQAEIAEQKKTEQNLSKVKKVFEEE